MTFLKTIPKLSLLLKEEVLGCIGSEVHPGIQPYRDNANESNLSRGGPLTTPCDLNTYKCIQEDQLWDVPE